MRHTGVSHRAHSACAVRWVARALFVVPITLLLGILGAAPASAHAVLEQSTPAADTVLEASPDRLSLTFDESVLAAGDALHLYDDRLAPVAIGTTTHPGGRGSVIAAAVPTRLHTGTYTVTWRVTSADTHVVSGSFAFSVGHRTPVRGVPSGERVDPTTSHLAAIARAIGYAGLVAGPGALMVLAWLWPAGLARRRIRRTLITGGAVLVVATAAGVVIQGASAAGVGLGHAFTGADLRLGMAGRYGRAAAARFVLLVVIMWVAVASHRRRGRVDPLEVSVATAALAATWPYAGHEGTGNLAPVAFVADWVHVLAMATWLGGLLVVLIALSRGADADEPPDGVVTAFSEWALAAVTLLVATGVFAAWRNVRAWGALTATHYGRLLLWKSGVVVAVVAAAYLSRRVVASRQRRDASTGYLRATVSAEAAGAVAVLVVTSFLTGTAQASESYAPAFTRSASDGGVTVTVHVDRTGVGTAHLDVSATRAGRVQPISHIDGTLTETDPPVGPLSIRFRPAGTGKEASTVTFPDQGEWTVSLDVQTSAIEEIAVTTSIRVRG